MTRAHLYRPITDAAGNLRPGVVVRVLEPESLTEVAVPLYVANSGPYTIPNPFTSESGIVDFYLEQPRRVRLGIKISGQPEQYFENVDVMLPFDDGAPHHGHPYAPTGHTHDYAAGVHEHLAEWIKNYPTGNLASTNVQASLTELDNEHTAHLDDPTDAHDASAVSVVPTGGLASVNVQTALAELDSEHTAHLVDPTDAHDASAVSFVPTGNLAAVDVQAALVELDTEKAAAAHGTHGVSSVNGRVGAVTGLAEASHGTHGVSSVNGRAGAVTGLAEAAHGTHGVSSVNGRAGDVTGLSESTHGHVYPVDSVNGRTGAVTGLSESTHTHPIPDSPNVKGRLANFTTDADGFALVSHAWGWTPGAVVATGYAPNNGSTNMPISVMVTDLQPSHFQVRAFHGATPHSNSSIIVQFIGIRA